MDQSAPSREGLDLPLQIIRHGTHRRAPQRWPWAISALVVLAAGVYLASPYLPEPLRTRLPWSTAAQAVSEPSPNQAAPVRAAIFGLGKITPEGDVVAVAPPFGAGDSRIAELRVTEGEQVEKGEIIAVLDSEPSLKAAIAQQKADVAVQQTIVEQVKQASAVSRAETRANIEAAETALQTAQDDFERTQLLARRGVVSRAVLDQKRAAMSNAQGTLDRDRATLTRFDQGLESGRQDVAVAEMRLAASRAALARAETDLEKAYVRAPIRGTILALDNDVGERPSATGMARLADLSRMTAEIDVYQNLIGKISLGQNVTLSSDALSSELKGNVSRIGLQVEKQTSVDSSPAANTDARVIKVTVTIAADSLAEAQRFTGLQVFARFESPAP